MIHFPVVARDKSTPQMARAQFCAAAECYLVELRRAIAQAPAVDTAAVGGRKRRLDRPARRAAP